MPVGSALDGLVRGEPGLGISQFGQLMTRAIKPRRCELGEVLHVRSG
jgi:hypothetical protein